MYRVHFLLYLYPLHQVTGLKNCFMAYASTKYPSIFCYITATGHAHTTLVPIAGSGAIIADIIAAVKLTASTGGGTVCIANIDTKAFILKCFARSTSIITISTVIIAVLCHHKNIIKPSWHYFLQGLLSLSFLNCGHLLPICTHCFHEFF